MNLLVHLHDRPGLFDPLDPAELYWWVPTLGPTTSLLLPILIHAAKAEGGEAQIDMDDLCFVLGSIRPGQLSHALARLERFGLAWNAGIPWHVMRWLPEVTTGNRLRAPQWWRDQYDDARAVKS